MRVLHIIDSAGLYGAEMVLLNLVEEQIKQGLNTEIASIGSKGTDEKPIESAAIQKNLPVRAFRMAPGPNPIGMMRVLRYARQTNVDILHSHGYKGNVAFGLIPRAMRQTPMVSTVHGYTSHRGFSKNRIYELMDLFSLRFIDHVVLVNRGMLASPRLKALRRSRLSVIDNGIALNSTINTMGGEPSLDANIVKFCKDGVLLGSIGRLSREKGYDLLLKACAKLRQGGVDAKVIIIGEGYARKELDELIKFLDLHEAVFLPGYRQNAARYMSLFDVYVISSHTEGLPMTLLEAMSAGTPIIATTVGGIPNVLDQGRCGVLVPPDNADAIAEAVQHINRNPDIARRMTKMGLERVSTLYSSHSTAIDYLALYRNMQKAFINNQQDLRRHT